TGPMTISPPVTSARVVLIDDDTTPEDFVVDLLVSVFAKAEADARELVRNIGRSGRIECGPYPFEVARALLRAATAAATAKGHPLKIVCEQLPQTAQTCDFCGQAGTATKRFFRGPRDFICEDCIRANADQLDAQTGAGHFKYSFEALNWHFAN